ncbi:MAG: MerR family transcriptional regulator [Actinobacteria bacterium]|nr:MAG: MerR family transcriptional regulator [Actinomycetota bacterium]
MDRRSRGGERPLYMISVAAELAGMHPQTLRIYERKQLIKPQRSGGNTRLYSDADIERLRLITQLTAEGINLAGVIRILELRAQAEGLAAEAERLRIALAHAEARAALARAEARAQARPRTEIVLVQRGGMVRREQR